MVLFYHYMIITLFNIYGITMKITTTCEAGLRRSGNCIARLRCTQEYVYAIIFRSRPRQVLRCTR